MTSARGARQPSSELLRLAARLHLFQRVTSRLVLGFGRADSSPRRRRAALVFIAYDLAGAWWLRRKGRPFGVVPRLASDAADIFGWSLVQPDGYALSALVGTTLATEAGFRVGLKGAVVPATTATAVAGVRRAVGRPARVDSFLWHLFAVIAGDQFAGVERRHLARLAAQHEAELAAATQRAMLAGQHDVATEADNVVDLLVRTTPLMQVDGKVRRDPLHEWKEELAWTARQSCAYLAEALYSWAATHNARSAVLAHDVRVTIDAQEGMLLLTHDQVSALEAELSRLRPRGDAVVRVVKGGASVGDEVLLEIRAADAVAPVPLPRAADAPSPPLNPVPFVAALHALWCAGASVPGWGRVRVRYSLPALAANAWVFQRARAEIAAEHPDIYERATLRMAATAVLCSLTTTHALREDESVDGFQINPFGGAIIGPVGMLAAFRSQVDRRARWQSAGLIAAAVGFGIATRRNRRGRDVLVSFQVPLFAAATVWRFTDLVGRIATSDTEHHGVEIEMAAGAAFLAGREHVIRLVGDAVARARATFIAVGGELPVSLSEEVARRLALLDQKLTALEQH